METRRAERINKLIQALKRSDKIHLKDAASLLRVSEMTIRRDLSAEPSAVILLGGYVVMDPKVNNANNYFVSDQQAKQVEEKRRIGQLAAQLIEENDTVFFDCGTTIPLIIDEIAEDLIFTAICYSLNTFLSLQDKPNCKVILCGGEFKPNNYIFTPIGQHNELDNICPNKAFISAAGISPRYGVTCFNFDELPWKQQALEKSQHKILVVDHSKFGQIKPASIGSLTLFDALVTDRQPDKSFSDFFVENGIKTYY
ncbi:DNA-binding transcriptional repressor DeoR [Yersinia ruckeri]|uniref:DNA-binding transcriptional repressor DeoR n=1 Tax=Yersinia ruckeri TaxID=29486 RepID=UPI0011A9834C|nr:DNA-binding transcriptional repressor DeoR [Yersinia ruckeri]EKN3345192.1 DNA-binding transcriptional repressor DeoR [Yersinia ruckeri]EKN3360611.1 DNA-binding transcriptional repressor DeoR [Yersinia ruckeri]EKN4200349.1 DNA-binding transcriptional repressor DeoR [Yersinia ruckeri]EKN4206978.1 DNA-binding transcriptional repressor DeoR [Yersinia ruckeri]EKN4724782.1 DNA-binding transcriptional repressor DeoR [Yersinia ruckeri]